MRIAKGNENEKYGQGAGPSGVFQTGLDMGSVEFVLDCLEDQSTNVKLGLRRRER